MDTPVCWLSWPADAVRSGLWAQLPGLGSAFSPGLGCFCTLSLFLQVLGAGAPQSLGGRACRVPAHITLGPHGLVTPNTQGTDSYSTCLRAQIKAFSLRRQLQLPRAGHSSEA